MSFIKSSFSAFGKLLIVGILSAAFLFGMAGAVYMSLQGEEIKVPEIVGKDFVVSEDELAKLGLKIKRRADRVSSEKVNTVLEQLPKAGETVKTGQMILVVVSKHNPDGSVPDTIKKADEESEIEKIEELISDKPKKSSDANDNSNKKKSAKTRDIIANKPDDSSDSDKSDNKGADSGNKAVSTDDKKPGTVPGEKNPGSKPSDKPEVIKPENKRPADRNVKPASGTTESVTRPRKTP